MKQKCERCGSCCLQIGDIINISEEDIRRWVNEGRVDILQYCSGWNNECYDMFLWDQEELVRYLNEGINMEMWFDPESGDEVYLCPFLRKKYGRNEFECMIHDTKPEICRDYICNPKDMRKIIKKSFEKNLKEYKKKRKIYHLFNLNIQ
jgi:Fe-S-cluster containining protein